MSGLTLLSILNATNNTTINQNNYIYKGGCMTLEKKLSETAEDLGDAEVTLTTSENALVHNISKADGQYPDEVSSVLNEVNGANEFAAKYSAKSYIPSAHRLGKPCLDLDEVTSANNLAANYVVEGDFDNALAQFQQVLAILKDGFSEDLSVIADAHWNVVNLYYKFGEYGKGLQYYEQELLSFEAKVRGQVSSEIAPFYSNPYARHREHRDYLSVFNHYQRLTPRLGLSFGKLVSMYSQLDEMWHSTGYRSLRVRARRASSVSDLIWELNHKIGKYYQFLNEFQQGHAAYYTDIHDKQDLKMGISSNLLGVTYFRLGDYLQALKCFQQALEIFQAQVGEQPPEVRCRVKALKDFIVYCKLKQQLQPQISSASRPTPQSSPISICTEYGVKGTEEAVLLSHDRVPSSSAFPELYRRDGQVIQVTEQGAEQSNVFAYRIEPYFGGDEVALCSKEQCMAPQCEVKIEVDSQATYSATDDFVHKAEDATLDAANCSDDQVRMAIEDMKGRLPSHELWQNLDAAESGLKYGFSQGLVRGGLKGLLANQNRMGPQRVEQFVDSVTIAMICTVSLPSAVLYWGRKYMP